MTFSLSLVMIFRTNTRVTFDFLQHHVHIHHRRDCDEHKAVVVGKHHFQGC